MDKKKELKMTLVSIIVPVYNVQAYLAKCLDSLVRQTYKNIEIILVDDGSSDQSLSICEEFAQKDTRIKFISQKNSGVTSARISGLLNSAGAFIMFVDADDYVSVDIVELMMYSQQKYQVDMVCCQYYDVKDNKITSTLVRPVPGYYDKKKIEKLLRTNFLHDKVTEAPGMAGFLCAKLFRREFVHDALYAGRGIIHGEDILAIFKMLYSMRSMYVMTEYLYYYVSRKGQATRTYNSAYWKNFEKFFLRLSIIDRNEYLKKQLMDKTVMIIKYLLKMEFENSKISLFEQYLSVKNNFSEKLYLLVKDADISEMSRKTRLQYYLIVNRNFILYGVLIHIKKIMKRMFYRFLRIKRLK